MKGRGKLRMRRGAATIVIALAALAAGAGRQDAHDPPIVVLVSLDGLAATFLEYGETPTLERMARDGVRAEWMTPVFPTKTFTNHYSIVTGLYAEDHGIVSNNFYDPVFDRQFGLRGGAPKEGRWWGGEPLWVTVEKQGGRAAAFFWPGTEAEIVGMRPTFWRDYDATVPDARRVGQILEWLRLPESERPQFFTLYFSAVDDAVHDHHPSPGGGAGGQGLDGAEIRQALRAVDGAVAGLLEGVEALGLRDRVNVVIVSDHGFAATSPERVIVLDEYVSLDRVRVSDWSPVAAIWPEPGREDEVYGALAGRHPHLSVYRRSEIPRRYRYRYHRRIPPILAVADEGWSITSAARAEPERFVGATHGYDHELPSMRAVFLAQGPAFEAGLTVPPFQSIHVYELLCAVLGVHPAPNRGSLDSVRTVLRQGRAAAPGRAYRD